MPLKKNGIKINGIKIDLNIECDIISQIIDNNEIEFLHFPVSSLFGLLRNEDHLFVPPFIEDFKNVSLSK